jgi:hypothetical protein
MYGDALEEVVDERLVVRHGHPPEEHNAFRDQVTVACLQEATCLVEMLIASRTLPNGNWQNRDQIEAYVPFGVKVDRRALAAVIAWSLKRVFVGVLFTKRV